MQNRAQPDFVQVQLNSAGLEIAEGHPLTITGNRRALVFTPGQSTKVEKSFEWPWLRDFRISGALIFELAPPAAAPQPTLVTPAEASPAAEPSSAHSDPHQGA